MLLEWPSYHLYTKIICFCDVNGSSHVGAVIVPVLPGRPLAVHNLEWLCKIRKTEISTNWWQHQQNVLNPGNHRGNDTVQDIRIEVLQLWEIISRKWKSEKFILGTNDCSHFTGNETALLTTAWYLLWLSALLNSEDLSCSSPISSLDRNSLNFCTLKGKKPHSHTSTMEVKLLLTAMFITEHPFWYFSCSLLHSLFVLVLLQVYENGQWEVTASKLSKPVLLPIKSDILTVCADVPQVLSLLTPPERSHTKFFQAFGGTQKGYNSGLFWSHSPK